MGEHRAQRDPALDPLPTLREQHRDRDRARARASTADRSYRPGYRPGEVWREFPSVGITVCSPNDESLLPVYTWTFPNAMKCFCHASLSVDVII